MYAVSKVQGVVNLGVRKPCPRLVQSRPSTASNTFRVKAKEDAGMLMLYKPYDRLEGVSGSASPGAAEDRVHSVVIVHCRGMRC